MSAYSGAVLSGSTSGRGIKIVQTATPGTTVHTAVAGATAFDEVYAWVTNTSAAPVNLTVEWGGTTNPDDHIVDTISIPANSLPIPILTGQRLNGALAVKMYASVANVLVVTGNINRVQ